MLKKVGQLAIIVVTTVISTLVSNAMMERQVEECVNDALAERNKKEEAQ